MSDKGKLFRGAAYVNRDPASLRPSEKEDLDFYLNSKKEVEPPKEIKKKEKE